VSTTPLSSALRPFLIQYLSTVESASISQAFEAVQKHRLPYKRSTVKAMFNDDKQNFQRVAPGVFRLHPDAPLFESEPPVDSAPGVVELPPLNCARCGRPMIPSCGCTLPTDVVLAALRATLENTGSLKINSLNVAVLTDELFERGCEIAGVRREVTAAS
jgi:hypothetical protein